jgi:hypothetical protein
MTIHSFKQICARTLTLLLLGISTFVAVPAPVQAQYSDHFFRPMRPAPVYREAPMYRSAPMHRGERYGYDEAPVIMPLTTRRVINRLARQGFDVNRVWRQGDVYLAQGVDRRGAPVRVVADPYEGSVLEVIALGAPVIREKPRQNNLRAQDNPRLAARAPLPPQGVPHMNSHEAAPHVIPAPRSIIEKQPQVMIQPHVSPPVRPLTPPLPPIRSTQNPPSEPQVQEKVAQKPVVKQLIPSQSRAQKPAIAPIEEVKPTLHNRLNTDKI